MNYRHAFHAGNFADVFKHIILARIVEYLKRKDKAFRVIDTHAGTGIYDLRADQAQRTGEWLSGIARLDQSTLNEREASLFNPLTDVISALNEGGELKLYPGSPYITRALLRKQDRLTAIELHPQDAETLREVFAGDHQVRVIALDGWLALGAHLPPKEKRGLVLIDPPFEQPGEFERMVSGLTRAYRRWPGGIYAFWYPIKNLREVGAFREALRACGVPNIIDVSFQVASPEQTPGLSATGMVIVNPPYGLEDELNIILQALTRLLGQDDSPIGAGYRIERLADEKTSTHLTDYIE